MKFQFYIEKLEHSKEYKNFIKKYKDAYFCSGFLSVDKEGKDNQIHLDFYSPSKKELFSFNLTEGVKFSKIEIFDSRVPEKISSKLEFDLKDFEKLIEKELEKKKIKTKIKKFLFSLQKLEKKDFLIATIFISNLGLLKVHMDVELKKITSFEKKSFLNFFKIVKGKKKKKEEEK